MKYGRLTYIKHAGYDRHGKDKWLCSCECGTTKTFLSNNVERGISRSCGCLRAELMKAKRTTHGRSATKVYYAWEDMRGRCYDTNDKHHIDYGERGISVCPRWHTFENFLADIGEPPTRHHSIDRIDNNGNYEPGNVRWADRSTQARNKRNIPTFTIDDITKPLVSWAEEYGISIKTVRTRMSKGLDTLTALTRPIKS